MARYDYGLRGPWDTVEPRFARPRVRAYGRDYDPREIRTVPTNRVTARYNADYIQPRGERYPFNPYRFGGDSPGRIGDERDYRQPFMTRGGTRTSRGAPPPPIHDYRAYGPHYGGRYPDEL
jgi:hypothetical protein